MSYFNISYETRVTRRDTNLKRDLCVAMRVVANKPLTDTMEEIGLENTNIRHVSNRYREYKAGGLGSIPSMITLIRLNFDIKDDIDAPSIPLTDEVFATLLKRYAGYITGATVEEMGRKTKNRYVVLARQLVWHVLKQYNWRGREVGAVMPVSDSTIRRYYMDEPHLLRYEDYRKDTEEIMNYAKTLTYEKRYSIKS